MPLFSAYVFVCNFCLKKKKKDLERLVQLFLDREMFARSFLKGPKFI